ncbi:acyl-CoA reductase [Alicyclobacillus cellulosilyticus]|uniref:long-chain-fatty-acyl-CoA reductase n=1 Tax=Alicyclobacillus cellulosilyticus TaxID=1003997 RepID=A0A917K751_9BACL|nr:acyl-CoA reductase [Alicyclobacillus cellulosilyticus]GGJ03471.1 acyl-CoA reductase [Alicyclobacillus cellulosilyticus]
MFVAEGRAGWLAAEGVIRLPLWVVPPGVDLTPGRTVAVSLPGSGAGGDAPVRVELVYPEVTPAAMAGLAAAVRKACAASLARLKTAEVVDWIDAAVARWLDPDYLPRQWAERLLPLLTGYDAETVRLELKRLLRTFRRKELWRFLDADFANPDVLDAFRPGPAGGWVRALGPRLLVHYLSGNVPGLSVWSLVMGLLVKAGTIAKPASGEPLMAVLFARTLADIRPDLAGALAVVPWRGGDEAVEAPLLAQADAVVAYGSDQAVAAIARRVPPHARFLRYGHRISFAVIGREALAPDRYADTCHRLADDICVYDQQSCMSPQVVFVERGGAVAPAAFAALLAAEMERYQVRRPRGPVAAEEALAIQSFRGAFAFSGAEGTRVFASTDDTAWTVVYHEEPGFAPTPLNRSVHVHACDDVVTAVEAAAPYRPYLQSVGVAIHPARLFPLAERLAELGVSRIAAVGEMTRAMAGWHHDGRPNLADLVRFVDIEPSAERWAERLDADVEWDGA